MLAIFAAWLVVVLYLAATDRHDSDTTYTIDTGPTGPYDHEAEAP